MATQSLRSNGPGGPYDGGTAGIQSRRDCLVPLKSLGEWDEGVDDF